MGEDKHILRRIGRFPCTAVSDIMDIIGDNNIDSFLMIK
nr:MAG TPA: hypothetical protein [Caudoviricetes sp.]